jgi:hypothetical protein
MKYLTLVLGCLFCAHAFASAQLACERTSLLYAHYADTSNPVAMADLFAEDAIWQTTTGRYEGRAQIEAQLKSGAGQRVTMRHVITNHLVFSDNDGNLSGKAYFTLYLAEPGAGDLADQPIMMGTYEDTYTMQGELCLFSSRVSSATFRQPTPQR